MIERYTRPAMGRLWTEEARLGHWLEIELVFVEAGHAAMIAAARPRLDRLKQVVAFGGDAPAGLVPLDRFIAGQSGMPPAVALEETSPFAITFTGGTTGAYTVSFSVKPKKTLKVKSLGIPANAESVFEMPADDGALLTVKVRERTAPALNAVHVEDPAGNPLTFPPEQSIVKTKTTWSGKKMLVNEGLGDYRLVLTGSKSEKKLAAKFMRRAPTAVDLVDRTTVLQLAALNRYLALFVSSDTGALHVACATDVGVIALFGPTPAVYTGPYPPRPTHRLLQAPTIDGITVDQVLATILEHPAVVAARAQAATA